jgi:hypothetical protein
MTALALFDVSAAMTPAQKAHLIEEEDPPTSFSKYISNDEHSSSESQMAPQISLLYSSITVWPRKPSPEVHACLFENACE